jgi:hypothetical protein
VIDRCGGWRAVLRSRILGKELRHILTLSEQGPAF